MNVWFAFPELGELGRMNSESMELRTWPIGRSPASRPTDLVVDDQTLWVVSQDAGTLTALDTGSGRVLAHVELGGRPIKGELDGSDIVVTNPALGTLDRVPRVLADPS